MDPYSIFSVDIRPFLVPGAEDPEIIMMLMNLKEEVVQYAILKFEPSKGYPPIPQFYHTSMFWIFLKTLNMGKNIVYMEHIGEVIKTRIEESLPRCFGSVHVPALKEINQTFFHLDAMSVTNAGNWKESCLKIFEKVIGETYFYLQKYKVITGDPNPPKLEFLVQFAQLFSLPSFVGIGGESMVAEIVPRLQRNMPSVDSSYFRKIEEKLEMALKK